MKIVWFSWKDHAHPQAGGAEVVTSQLAKRLVADGHQLILITSQYPGAKHEGMHNGYKIVRLPNKFRLGVYWLAWRYYRKNFAASDAKPDLVIDEMNTLPFFASLYSDTKTILFVHQLARRVWFHEMFFPLSLIGYLLEPLYIRLISHTHAITVSHSSRMDLVRYGFKAKRVHIIPEGITMKPASSLPRRKPDQPPTMLAFGAIRSMKGTLDAVQAFERAKTAIPNLQMIVAGPPIGSYGHKVLLYIMNSKYTADISAYGAVDAQKKRELMQKAHILVSAARKEGWGLTISEAASQGALPVVYDVDGLRDAVFNGKGGIRVKPNQHALTKGIIHAFTKDHSAKRLFAYQQAKRLTFDRSYLQFIAILTSIKKLNK